MLLEETMSLIDFTAAKLQTMAGALSSNRHQERSKSQIHLVWNNTPKA